MHGSNVVVFFCFSHILHLNQTFILQCAENLNSSITLGLRHSSLLTNNVSNKTVKFIHPPCSHQSQSLNSTVILQFGWVRPEGCFTAISSWSQDFPLIPAKILFHAKLPSCYGDKPLGQLKKAVKVLWSLTRGLTSSHPSSCHELRNKQIRLLIRQTAALLF